MTFTYALADLSSTDTTTQTRTLVRLRIGDTDSNDPLLADEEIEALMVDTTSVPALALKGARLILARIARDIDTSGAGMNTSRSQKTQHYRDLVSELEAELRVGGQPYLGGVSRARQTEIEANSDYKRPSFSIGMHDDLRGRASDPGEIDG